MEMAFNFKDAYRSAVEQDRAQNVARRSREVADSGDSKVVRELKAINDLENLEQLKQKPLRELRPEIQKALAYFLENLTHNEYTLDEEDEIVEAVLPELRQKLSQLKVISEKIAEVKKRRKDFATFAMQVKLNEVNRSIGKKTTKISKEEEVLDPLMVNYGKSVDELVFLEAEKKLQKELFDLEDYFSSTVPELQRIISISLSLQEAADADTGLYKSKSPVKAEVGATTDFEDSTEKTESGLVTFAEYAEDLKNEYQKALDTGDDSVIRVLERMVETFISNFEVKAARFLYNKGVLKLENLNKGREVEFVESLPEFKDYEQSPLVKIIKDLRATSKSNQDFYFKILDFIIELSKQNTEDARVGREKAETRCQEIIGVANTKAVPARLFHKSIIMKEADRSGINSNVLVHFLGHNPNYRSIITPLK